jgi:hypothetical protein
MNAAMILALIEGLSALGNILAVEDREATPEELEASGIRTDASLDRLQELIRQKRAEQS